MFKTVSFESSPPITTSGETKYHSAQAALTKLSQKKNALLVKWDAGLAQKVILKDNKLYKQLISIEDSQICKEMIQNLSDIALIVIKEMWKHSDSPIKTIFNTADICKNRFNEIFQTLPNQEGIHVSQNVIYIDQKVLTPENKKTTIQTLIKLHKKYPLLHVCLQGCPSMPIKTTIFLLERAELDLILKISTSEPLKGCFPGSEKKIDLKPELIVQSDMLIGLCKSKMKENENREILFPILDPETIQLLCEHAWDWSKLNLNEGNIEKVLTAIAFLQIHSLRKPMDEILCKSLLKEWSDLRTEEGFRTFLERWEERSKSSFFPQMLKLVSNTHTYLNFLNALKERSDPSAHIRHLRFCSSFKDTSFDMLPKLEEIDEEITKTIWFAFIWFSKNPSLSVEDYEKEFDTWAEKGFILTGFDFSSYFYPDHNRKLHEPEKLLRSLELVFEKHSDITSLNLSYSNFSAEEIGHLLIKLPRLKKFLI